jgi:acetyl-CoA carboxylase biotin carboxyl carrier protein
MAETKKAVPSRGADNGDSAMRIDPALVRELAELLTENALTEIEVADGDRRIKVARGAAPAAAPAAAAAPAVASSAAAPSAQAAPEPAAEEISGMTVKSPMVGTAFLAPDPSSAPFVSVGDAVKAGDTLLIVEAMKVMNPITAPEGGMVKKILVADAQPVEFDQPLVIIG